MNIFSRNLLIELISSLFILLFVYTGIDKVLHHAKFWLVIFKSPLIAGYSHFISWAVPVLEFCTAALLFIPSLRKTGLVASFILMTAFSIYITYMLLASSHLPCSCGGIISKLTWKQHLTLNVFLILLAGAGIWLSKQNKDFIAINRTSRKPV